VRLDPLVLRAVALRFVAGVLPVGRDVDLVAADTAGLVDLTPERLLAVVDGFAEGAERAVGEVGEHPEVDAPLRLVHRLGTRLAGDPGSHLLCGLGTAAD